MNDATDGFYCARQARIGDDIEIHKEMFACHPIKEEIPVKRLPLKNFIHLTFSCFHVWRLSLL